MYVYVYYISTCILNINNYPLEYYSIYGLIMQDHTDAWLQWVTQTGVGAGAEKNPQQSGGYLLHTVAIGNMTHMLISTINAPTTNNNQ